MKNKWLAWFATRIIGILPIDRQGGGNPLSGPTAALKRGEILVLFPEGSRGLPEQITDIQARRRTSGQGKSRCAGHTGLHARPRQIPAERHMGDRAVHLRHFHRRARWRGVAIPRRSWPICALRSMVWPRKAISRRGSDAGHCGAVGLCRSDAVLHRAGRVGQLRRGAARLASWHMGRLFGLHRCVDRRRHDVCLGQL